MGRLDGKVAFITGAGRGQGRSHAVRLASEGADIIAIDIAAPLPHVLYDQPTPEDLEQTVKLVEAEGRRIIARAEDVRNLEGMRSIVDEAVGELGGLDIVVANAAISTPVTWDETTPEIFKDTMDINVTGVWNTVMVSATHLITRGGGSVILISSYAAKKVQPFMIAYTTSKHAVVGLTRAFAAELGKYKIRVNSIHPGAVNTPMGGGEMQSAMERAAATNPPLAKMLTPFLPQWNTDPEAISAAVAYLASDEASYVTCEHLSVDGGAQYY
jgi:SDR family mycofactocin-dependent oxidoreductase